MNGPPSRRDDRRARQELQLRENLKRRKEQARARRDNEPGDAPAAAETAADGET